MSLIVVTVRINLYAHRGGEATIKGRVISVIYDILYGNVRVLRGDCVNNSLHYLLALTIGNPYRRGEETFDSLLFLLLVSRMPENGCSYSVAAVTK